MQPVLENAAKNLQAAMIGKVIVIDHDAIALRVIRKQLLAFGHQVQTFENTSEGLRLVSEDTTAVLIDSHLIGLEELAKLRSIRRLYPKTQFLFLTSDYDCSFDDVRDALESGEFRCLNKPCSSEQLQTAVQEALECYTELSVVVSQHLNEPVKSHKSFLDAGLIQQIDKLAALDSTIFIGGESGTGKSTIARLIHGKSKRRKGPFVAINCASLPRELLTSELFGHTRGAFTGADRDRAGHAEVADGGTLFLDEIGDLPLESQPKLLSFLQDRCVQRLGSSQSKKVDVRVIVATHRDLSEMCRSNEFRQDLYFRLMVLHLDLLPLRLRRHEIPALANSILHELQSRMGGPLKRLSSRALEILNEYSWPGNIRELENVLERAAAYGSSDLISPKDLVMTYQLLDQRSHRESLQLEFSRGDAAEQESAVENTQSDDSLSVSDLSDETCINDPRHSKLEITEIQAEVYPPELKPNANAPLELAGMTLDEIERLAIIQTLVACNGNKAKSARQLGISEKSIYNKMRRLKIERW